MLDGLVRPWIDPPLHRIARLLVRLGFSATTMTVVGFVLGLAGCLCLVYEAHRLALGFILANRVADGLDGSMARQTTTSHVGAYLDIVLDMIFYSGVPFAFAVARAEWALPGAFLVYSFVGTGGSFLAYAVLAARRGWTTERAGRKSFYYAAGLMEGTETILFLILFCIIPEHFALLAWLFGGLCWLTTLARLGNAVLVFRQPHPEKSP